MIDPDSYRIVGYDLLEFFNYTSLNLDNKIITMCIITDAREDQWLFEDYTETKIVQVTATKYLQAVFEIPNVVNGNLIKFDQFLLFKDSVCLEEGVRYRNNYDEGTITLLNYSDWLNTGEELTFVFIYVNKCDQWGKLWIKPIFEYMGINLSTSTGYTASNPLMEVDIPNIYNIKFTMNNLMVFDHDKLVIPRRYRIEDNKLKFMNPADGLIGQPELTFVVLKMASQIEKKGSRNNVLIEKYRKGKRFLLENLNIDKKRKITLDNITAFDQNGEYIPDLCGYIYNMNIIKQLYTTSMDRVVQSIQVIYHDWSEENYANVTLPDNDDFIKRTII